MSLASISFRVVRRSAVRGPCTSLRALRRSYAATSTPANVKPPVELYGVDGTYATALYTAASKASALETTAKAIESLSAVFANDSRLSSVLSSPRLSDADKSGMVNELSKHTGAQATPSVVKNFLTTLAGNNRLSQLESVCNKFQELMSAHKGEVELVITSAQNLDPKILRQIETVVSKSSHMGPGKKLKIVSKVNPDIKGGLIVEIGDKTIDLSVSSKITKMNKLLNDQL